MSHDYELEAIDRQIASENDRHRTKIEQLRQQKQRLKDRRAREKEQEQQKKYRECIDEIYKILTEQE